MNMVNKKRFSRRVSPGTRVFDLHHDLFHQVNNAGGSVAEFGPILLHPIEGGLFGYSASIDVLMTTTDPETNIERGVE